MPAHQKLREVSIPRSEGLEDPQVLPVSAAQGLRAMDAAPVIGLQKPPDLPVEEVQQFLVSGDLGDERVEAEKAGRSAESAAEPVRAAMRRCSSAKAARTRTTSSSVMARAALRQASPSSTSRIS